MSGSIPNGAGPATVSPDARIEFLDVMRSVREEGVSDTYLDRLCVFKDFAKIVRLDDIRSKEDTYLPKDVLESKYHGNTRIVAE